ncbi:hypothetical protein PBRA_001313 [Plasmodiophora brassicae]|uniref:Uncharacterized protein n=1 Tax=Plasmodiophora brassicae TaxID=37360 RepID=A0A0G4IVY7_PLABS|nr:hypothetical protein PBRA_001313 [Plasmodiophora brassicae]
MCHTYLLPGLHKVQGVISTVVVRCLPGSPRTKEEAALVDNGSALIETSAPSQCEALPPPPLPARARLEGEPEEDQCPPGSPTESKAELPDDTLSLSGLLRGIDKRLLTELEVGYSAVVVAIRSRLPDMSCQSPWTKASALAYGPFAWVAQGNYLATSCIDSVVGYGQRAYKLITDGIGGFRARTVNFLS